MQDDKPRHTKGENRGVTKQNNLQKQVVVAGETRFEHATDGFGDRCSTVEPLPYKSLIIIPTMPCIVK